MRKILLSMLFLFLLSGITFGQNPITISGKITDNNGELIIGANVTIKSLQLGATTNIEGKYSFEVPGKLCTGQNVELSASCISYKTKSVKISLSNKDIAQNFRLDQDAFKSEEVVVTGIASKTSKSVAEVSVARLPVGELTLVQPYASMSQLVTGKIPGVQVQTASGNVSTGWRFFVRGGGGLNGDGQPIIYIDGVRIYQSEISDGYTGGQKISPLTNLNPNDIDNIEILKGPSAAAMYGTNGSNGVVLITTKKGKIMKGSGKPYSIDYQYTYGTNNRPFEYDGDKYVNASRINAVLDPPGIIRDHSLSISGGTSALKYYTSFQTRDESGLIPSQNTMDRKGIKVNVTSVPTDNLSLQVNTSYTWNKIRRPNNDNNIFGWMLNALCYYPAYANCDSAAIAHYEDWHKLDQFTGAGKIMWKPIEHSEINVGLGLDYLSSQGDQYWAWGYSYGGDELGQRVYNNLQEKRFTYDINAKYYFNFFDKLNWTPIIGAQMLDRNKFSSNIDVNDFAHPDLTVIDAGATLNYKGSQYFNGREAGIFWENNINWDNTYFGTLAIRKDYASAFGSDAPSIVYPKASFAIRIDKFGVLPEDIPLLKLRASYGESGQLPGQLDGIGMTWAGYSGPNGVGIIPNSLGNTKIEPERVKEIEAGIDMEFMNMFSLEFSYYKQDASNSIVYSRLAPSLGFHNNVYPFNVGSVENHGFESMLQANPIKGVDFDLNLSVIWNYQTNEVKNLGETTELISNENVIKPGFKKFEFYDYVSDGPIFNSAGVYTGAKKSADKKDLGNPIPDHSGSVSMNLKFFKNFNLYAFCDFGLNGRIWSYTIYRMIRANSYKQTNILKNKLGLLTTAALKDPNITPYTPGTPEYIATATELAKYDVSYLGNFVYDADFFAIKEVSLSYDFTELMQTYVPNTYVSNFTAGVSARNLFRFSKYDLDYESNYAGGSSTLTYQSDLGTLPQARTYSFWVRFSF
jgi:TonB-dependent starch-binding outer membrane protein SusC